MRQLITSVFLVTFSTICIAQTANEGFSDGLGKVDYQFDVGTSVGTSFNDSYWFSNYFSPSATFDITKKFSIVAGIGVQYTQLNNLSVLDNEYNLQKTDAQITSIFTYASGIYKLNQKVNLNATILFDENLFSNPETPATMQRQYKDLSFGVNYNVTKNFSINAQMHISDRPMNMFNSGYSNFGVNSPIQHSPFF